MQVPDRNTVYRFTDLNHVFRHSIFGSIFGKAGLRISALKLEGVYIIEMEDGYVQPGISWSVIDGLALAVDVDLLGGPDDSYFSRVCPRTGAGTRGWKYSF